MNEIVDANECNQVEVVTVDYGITGLCGSVASLLKVLTKTMERQNSDIQDIALMQKTICEQMGIKLPNSFVNEVKYEQIFPNKHGVDSNDNRIKIIQDYLDSLTEDVTCVQKIFAEALGFTRKPNKTEADHIREILQTYIDGWMKSDKKVRFPQPYGVQRIYARLYQVKQEVSQ